MVVRAVLFDFDGTLVPSLPLWLQAYHFGLQHYGIVVSDEELLRRCFFRDWHMIAQEFGVFSAEEIRTQVGAGLKHAFTDAALFPGIRELLAHCRAHNLQVGLVTSAPRELVVDVIGRLSVHDLFDVVVCGDDVRNYKPHPEPVLAALAALQCAPAEAIMVGDSRADVFAGKAAGTRTALFLSEAHDRFHDREKLRAAAPDHLFTDHIELPALLGLPPLADSIRDSDPAILRRYLPFAATE